jgi:hypothetical protein
MGMCTPSAPPPGPTSRPFTAHPRTVAVISPSQHVCAVEEEALVEADCDTIWAVSMGPSLYTYQSRLGPLAPKTSEAPAPATSIPSLEF